MNRRIRSNLRRKCRDYHREIDDKVCEHCGEALGKSPRHHPDLDHHPNWIVLLCDPCHVKADQKLGKNWTGNHSRFTKAPDISEHDGKAISYKIL